MVAKLNCAVYTRKSSEEGLEQGFNSLHAQRESCEAYIKSQHHEGWRCLSEAYDDGGYSGGNTERPGLKALMRDIEAGKISTVIVYKVDRLTRSLADFAKIIEVFDRKKVSFVSVTQQFNTTNSMGRLTLNMLLSFAQFEREVTGERIRDKIAASKAKGLWMGGRPPLGYDISDRKLILNPNEAAQVVELFTQYLRLQSVYQLRDWAKAVGISTKQYLAAKSGVVRGGNPYDLHCLYKLLKNPLYVGQIQHKGKVYIGEHQAIIDPLVWQQVQMSLEQNARINQNSLKALSPSRLKGKLFDENGHVMTPTHCNNKTRRYRYYVTQILLKKKGQTVAGGIRRIGAGEIDELVAQTFLDLLYDEEKVRDWVKALVFDVQQECLLHARKWYEHWTELTLHTQNALLRSVLEKVILRKEQVQIRFNSMVLKRLVMEPSLVPKDLDPAQNESSYSLTVTHTVKLIQLSKNKSLVLVNGKLQKPNQTTPELVRAVCQGYVLNQKILQAGERRFMDIFAEYGVDRCHGSDLIRLALLSPTIVELILNGEEPKSLKIKDLFKLRLKPWKEQLTAIHSQLGAIA